jgi:hypothetical protein
LKEVYIISTGRKLYPLLNYVRWLKMVKGSILSHICSISLNHMTLMYSWFVHLFVPIKRSFTPLKLSILNNFQVLDKSAISGGVTGWCRAGEKTVCNKPIRPLVQYDINRTMVELFHGTVDRDNPILCKTELED